MSSTNTHRCEFQIYNNKKHTYRRCKHYTRNKYCSSHIQRQNITKTDDMPKNYPEDNKLQDNKLKDNNNKEDDMKNDKTETQNLFSQDYGKCCFCHDDCNKLSQACGRCMRYFSLYGFS